jgi:hypothetical protein
MAIANSTRAGMVRQLAELVRNEPAVRSHYYLQIGDVDEFWLLTEPMDIETERRVRRIRRTIFDSFPDTLFEFHLINPRLSKDLDPSLRIPEDAAVVIML